jgi:hypothetical protein
LAGVSADPEQATPLPTSCRSLQALAASFGFGEEEEYTKTAIIGRWKPGFCTQRNYVTKGEEEESKWLKMRDVPETKQCDSLLKAFC